MNFTLADTFLKIGSALASRSQDIIVRMDTRTTSPLLAHPLISGILGTGGTGKNVGIVPAPTGGFQHPARRGRVHHHRFP